MGEMIDNNIAVEYYSRKDVQDAIVAASQNKEVVGSYSGTGYGKRPDVLQYGNDILELAKNGVTSFHMSEETWKNPLWLKTEMNKKEQDDLRIGWDLVLDVDFVEWNSTKLITDALIKALKEHGIKSITCKFSGNKGFHIAVPFEAFPKEVHGKATKDLFPDGIRRIARYLMYYIDRDDKLSEKIYNLASFEEYIKNSGEKKEEFIDTVCSNCESKIVLKEKKAKIEFVCPRCEKREESKGEEFKKCERCKVFMDKQSFATKDKCPVCSNDKFKRKIDLAIDTILISPRHLFRHVYSLHEKSSLASVPVDIDNILGFDKKNAEIDAVKVGKYEFLRRDKIKEGEAAELIMKAFDFQSSKKGSVVIQEEDIKKLSKKIDYKELEEAIPEELFPPCIKNILKGLKDGKKRSLFILNNFLSCAGWNKEKIEERINKWNELNDEKLREVYIKGQLRYIGTKKTPPPNCDNKSYYTDLQICTPDGLCKRVKNPINYSKKRAFAMMNENKKLQKGTILSDEEKEKRKKIMEERKAFREEVKRKKENGEF